MIYLKNKYTVIICAATLVLLMPASLAAKDISFTGMLRSYTGARMIEGDVPVSEQTADLTLEGWGDDTRIKLNPYAYIETDGTTGGDGESEIGIREAFIDFYFPSLDIRVGKQAVVWGEAEGAFITDIVSPRDLRSFILADFSEIRKGVPAVKADYYAGPFTFEAVWLPRFVPTEQPAPDSIWYTEEMALTKNAERPGDSLENSEVFGKVSYFGSALNAELMAGYAFDDMPVVYEGKIDPATGEPDPETVDAGHERYTVVGGSFSTTIGSLVLRSEAAAYLDRAFTGIEDAGTPSATFAAREHHQLNGLAGLDWSLAGIDMSAQYILDYIHDYDEDLQNDDYDHTATFRMRDSYLSNTLSWEIFAYAGFDPEEFFSPEEFGDSLDTLLRPSLTYSFEDGVEVQAGAEIFFGDESGTFGTYEDNTTGYVSLRWYF